MGGVPWCVWGSHELGGPPKLGGSHGVCGGPMKWGGSPKLGERDPLIGRGGSPKLGGVPKNGGESHDVPLTPPSVPIRALTSQQ